MYSIQFTMHNLPAGLVKENSPASVGYRNGPCRGVRRVLTPLMLMVGIVFTQSTLAADSDPLFETHELVEITVFAPFKTINKKRDTSVSYPAKLSYGTDEGVVNLDIQVEARGKNRRKRIVCKSPPLRFHPSCWRRPGQEQHRPILRHGGRDRPSRRFQRLHSRRAPRSHRVAGRTGAGAIEAAISAMIALRYLDSTTDRALGIGLTPSRRRPLRGARGPAARDAGRSLPKCCPR